MVHLQGGGTAVWDEAIRWYVFVEPPEWSDFQPGDLVPEEWGIA